MPGENFLIAHWQSEAATLHNILFAFDPVQKGAVHKMRVTIKKLRAFLNLFILVTGRKDCREMFSNTEKLFSVLGEHRNLEINKNRAHEICCGNEELYWTYISWLNERQEKFRVEHAILQYDPAAMDKLSEIIKSEIGDHENHKLLEQSAEINDHYISKVRRHLHHFRRNFHQVRKELKVIFYLARISFPHPAFSKQEMHLLEEVLDHLGNIQDDEVTLGLLHEFRHCIFTRHEKDILHSSIVGIEMRKEEIMRKAREGTERFVFNVTA